jgi:hypothetical protein
MRREAAKFKITDEVKHEVPIWREMPIPHSMPLTHITSLAIRKISITPPFFPPSGLRHGYDRQAVQTQWFSQGLPVQTPARAPHPSSLEALVRQPVVHQVSDALYRVLEEEGGGAS